MPGQVSTFASCCLWYTGQPKLIIAMDMCADHVPAKFHATWRYISSGRVPDVHLDGATCSVRSADAAVFQDFLLRLLELKSRMSSELKRSTPSLVRVLYQILRCRPMSATFYASSCLTAWSELGN